MIFSQGKFAVAPTVLVTAEHISAAFKHDAASLWVENATSSSFYICLRELQNYDGLHEDIFVVFLLLFNDDNNDNNNNNYYYYYYYYYYYLYIFSNTL